MKAFPTLAYNGHSETQDGMELRDYFAALAMPWVASDLPGSEDFCELVAKGAYKMADAMMEARK